MKNKYAISLRKNTLVASYAKTSKGNYDAVSYKPFRKFATRKLARDFKKAYTGSAVVIINMATNQVVR